MEPSRLAETRAAVYTVPRTGDDRVAALSAPVSDGEISVEVAIAQMAGELQRLKSEMKAIGARQRFLGAFANQSSEQDFDIGLFPSTDQMADTEVELAREKSKLRTIKAEHARQEELLRSRSEGFASAYDSTAAARARAESFLATCELEDQRGQVQELLAGDDALPGLPDFLRVYPRLHHAPAKLLLNRLDMDIELREEIETNVKREKTILADISNRQSDVSRVSAELDNVLHDVDLHERSNPQSMHLRSTLQKADMRAALQNAFSGSKVDKEKGGDVVVDLSLAALNPDENASRGAPKRTIRIGTQQGQVMMATNVMLVDEKESVRGTSDLVDSSLATLTPIATRMEIEAIVASDV